MNCDSYAAWLETMNDVELEREFFIRVRNRERQFWSLADVVRAVMLRRGLPDPILLCPQEIHP
jgi:hypothetical protein